MSPEITPEANGPASCVADADIEALGGEMYSIKKKIGSGSFGVIYEGIRLSDGLPVAIKMEPLQISGLKNEYRVYQQMHAETPLQCIPKGYFHGRLHLHEALVLDLFGPSLQDMLVRNRRHFTLKTVVMIARRSLRVIEAVHNRGFIHGDIKPENFVLGRPGTTSADHLHIIDFGMAKKWLDQETRQHIPYREKRPISGTMRYMSINAHLGVEQSRRDDLETLGYMWLHFFRRLPWQGLVAPETTPLTPQISLIMTKKREVSIDALCGGLPNQFADYFRYVRDLGFDATPDYQFLHDLLSQALHHTGEVDDGRFDWVEKEGSKAATGGHRFQR